jgi:uncharacterized damage-inducible protein DinB
MKEFFLSSWQTHQRMNKLVIDNTTDEGMQKSMRARGGRTIYDQWVHIHNVRLQWLDVCAKDIFKENQTIGKKGEFNRQLLLSSLEGSAKGIEELLGRGWDDGGKLKSYTKSVFHFLGYMISHESHHRGNILLTLKQTGEKIPESLKWGLWEWEK